MPPKYVIINDCDQPCPSMVCQWVPGVGYCYMDRSGRKPTFDGMTGTEATSVEEFGWSCAEDADGVTRFYRSERPVTATYSDGAPRRWDHWANSFEWRRLQRKVAVA